jgi:hypothetical protein
VRSLRAASQRARRGWLRSLIGGEKVMRYRS